MVSRRSSSLPTWQSLLYLAIVLDAYSRRIVGWAMADHICAELVVEALDMVLGNRRPAPGLIHHSDHGVQYTSLAFGRSCREAGIARSMGCIGDCFDNALAETFFATLECELVARSR
jgi:transposase InsO family protein